MVSPQWQIKIFTKTRYIPILPAHWNVGNKTGLCSLVVQDTDAIKYRKVENVLFNFHIKKSQKEAF